MGDAVRKRERELVLRAQAGDRQAFGDLVTQHMRRAYFAALGFVGSHDDALDLSQDAFVRAFRAVQSIDADRPFYPWLYQIVRRLSFNFVRDSRARRERLEVAAERLIPAKSDPAKQAELAELRTHLEAAMDGLAAREREVLMLKEFEGLKYREIADLLRIPIGTVMSRLYSARRSLAASLEGKV